MFESIEEDTKVLIFRFSMAFFIGTLQVCGCLAGKMMKDYSERLYYVYSGFCFGLLLAKTIGSLIFSESSLSGHGLVWEMACASALLMAVLYHLQRTHLQTSVSSYSPLATSLANSADSSSSLSISAGENLDDDEDLEMEAHTDFAVPPAVEQSASVSDNLSMWRVLMLVACFSEGICSGWTVGFQEHRTLVLFIQLCLRSGLVSLIFGVVCEESIAVSIVYVQQIALFSCATPLGLLLGSLFSAASASSVVAPMQALLGVGNGLWLAAAFCVALPLDHQITSTLAAASANGKDSASFAWTTLRLVTVMVGFVVSILLSSI
jgi:hypothetical protein